LVPFRPQDRFGGPKVGEAALASTSLYAAAGWCAREFRVHDYLLGRSNMQDYLRRELVLSGDNPLFGKWGIDLRKDWALDANGERIAIDQDTPRNSYFLPVIPDKTEVEAHVPDWPNGVLDPDSLRPLLEIRLNAVLSTLRHDNEKGALPWIISLFAIPGAVHLVASGVVDGFKEQLKCAHLWPPE
jgi:hypothetical protein